MTDHNPIDVNHIRTLKNTCYEKDAEIHRLKRDLSDAVQNIQAHSMIVDANEKDAEIERLRAQIILLQEQGFCDQAELLRLTGENERLKADVEYWHHIATVEKNGLITELCDALELPFEEWTDQSDLLQRAREATR